MFCTSVVPLVVPSLCHSSAPFVLSPAAKNRSPPTFVRYFGLLLPEPGLISFTSLVLAAAPSLRHNSMPLTPSAALKSSVPPISVRFAGSLQNFPVDLERQQLRRI